MAKYYRKQRVLEPTSNNLGYFEAKDLEEVQTEWEETDGQNEGQQGQNQKSQQSHQPADDTEKPEQKKEDYPDEWDPYGDSLDEQDPDEEENSSDDDSDGDSSVGDSQQGLDSDSGDSEDGEDSENDREDSSNSEEESGNDENNDIENGSGDDNEEDTYDSNKGRRGSTEDENSEDDEDEYPGGDTEDEDDIDGGETESNNRDSSGNKENKETDGNDIEGSNSESQDKNSEDSNSSSNSQSDENDDFNPEGDDNINNLSDLEKAIKEMEDSKTDSEKLESTDDTDNEEDVEVDDQDSESLNDETSSDEQKRAAREALAKAVEDAKRNGDKKEGEESEEDKVLGDMGGNKLTNLFNPKTAGDWKSKLEKLFDKALGFEIYTNPNAFNKKIEDAPPGREDENPVIQNILILMDWSGSMSALKYKSCISHLDTMLRARNLSSVNFHIIPWGDKNVNEILRYCKKCKGRQLKEVINSTFSKEGPWMTCLAAGLEVASVKVKHPDAIIVLTDMDLTSTHDISNSDIAQRYLRKNREKFIWALTPDSNVQQAMNFLKEICPYSYTHKNVIKFKTSN